MKSIDAIGMLVFLAMIAMAMLYLYSTNSGVKQQFVGGQETKNDWVDFTYCTTIDECKIYLSKFSVDQNAINSQLAQINCQNGSCKIYAKITTTTGVNNG